MTLKEYFGDWLEFMEEPQLQHYREMIVQGVSNGIQIEPAPTKVFRCFRETDPNNLKVVILGMDPYSDGSATGLAFANPEDKKSISPSLRVIKDSVLSLVSSGETPIFDQTLETWAKQGILLLNSALTVRKGAVGSHLDAWKPFIERLLVSISGKTNACFLLFGKVAWSFKDCIFDNERGVFLDYHPAYYARNNVKMPPTIWKNMLEYVQENFGTTLKLYE